MANNTTPVQSDNQLKQKASLIGSLMLAQMGLGIFLNFFLLKPILMLDADNVSAGIPWLIGFSTLTALVVSSINIFYAQLLPRTVASAFQNTTTLVIVFAAAGFVLCAVEYVKLTEYVSYAGEMFKQFGQDLSPAQEHLRKTFATGRNKAHFLSMILSSLSLLLFYILMYRSRLITKQLGAFAIFSCALQLIAVGHTLFELAIPALMQLPLFITQIIVPIYLITRGFNRQQQH